MSADIIFKIIQENPGVTSLQIYHKLVEDSRAARWFGKDSLWTDLFGPSIGGLHVNLAQLEEARKIRSAWVDGPFPRRRVYCVSNGGISKL